MQEAIECFNKNEFSLAEKLFDKIKSHSSDHEELYTALTYLLEIYKKTKPQNIFKTQIEILETLFKNKGYSDFIKFYNDENLFSKNINFELKQKLLSANFIEGNIEEVNKLINLYSLFIIEEKIYNHANLFYEWIEKNKLETLKTMFSKLLFQIEVSNEEGIVNTCEKIENLLILNWKSIYDKKKTKTKYFEHLIDTLESAHKNTYKIKQKILSLKVKAIALGSELAISNTEQIEYVVLNSKNQIELALMISTINDQFLRIDLKEIISGLGKINNQKLGLYSNELKQYFDKKSNVIISSRKPKEESIDVELFGYEAIKDSEIEEIFNYYKSENLERTNLSFEAMSLIRYDHEVEKEPYHLITTFIELNLYDAALMMAKKLDESNSKAYLCARILYFNEKYIEAISLINEKINFSLMSEIESLPYYYLKAESYTKIGKESEAQNLYSLISTFNPNFRSLKERMI